MTCPISVLVLTYNEEANLRFLLDSLAGWTDAIYIIDSGSKDRTLEIAREYNTHIEYNPWTTHAGQFNWGLRHLPISTDWVMRMDADECVTPELAKELSALLPSVPDEIAGLYVKRRVYFMGQWIRHGGYYPTWLLRVFRRDQAFYEDRGMDEHVVLEGGRTQHLDHDIIDENHKGMSFWTIKHDRYAHLEMKELLVEDTSGEQQQVEKSLVGSQVQRKRWMKGNIYGRSPLFLRAFAYFCYRYFLRLGFLDGTEGLIFHTLQGFWYRFYVEA